MAICMWYVCVSYIELTWKLLLDISLAMLPPLLLLPPPLPPPLPPLPQCTHREQEQQKMITNVSPNFVNVFVHMAANKINSLTKQSAISRSQHEIKCVVDENSLCVYVWMCVCVLYIWLILHSNIIIFQFPYWLFGFYYCSPLYYQ